MGNCLKVKLKGTVDNSNLPVFDKIKVKKTGAGGFVRITPVSGMSYTIQAFGGGEMSINGVVQQNPLTRDSAANINCSNGNYDILFGEKSSINVVTIRDGAFEVSIEDFAYCENITDITLLDSAKGNIEALKGIPNLTNIWANNGLYGDITKAFGDKLLLTKMYLNVNTGIKGDFVEFARAQYANGRNSAEIAMLGVGDVAKFNGQNLRNANANLSWDSQTGLITLHYTSITADDLTAPLVP